MHKLSEYARRYVPMEIVATCTALLGAFAAHITFGNPIITAFAGTWGENIGYYGVAIAREIREHSSKNSNALHIAYRTIRNIIVEFGVAEVLDSFFVRPFFMYMMPLLIGSVSVGILVGKICADVSFYGCTIVFYELKKKLIKD